MGTPTNSAVQKYMNVNKVIDVVRGGGSLEME